MKIFLLGFVLVLSSSINAKEIKFLSYNLGLAHTFVPYAKERTPHLIEALKNVDADVICLQEVWTKKDRKKVKKALKKVFPHVHMSKIKQQKTKKLPACKISNLFGEGKFVTCFQSKCKDMSGDEFTDCVITNCRKSLDDLKESRPDCAKALMAQVGKNPILSILRLLNPFWRPGVFTYKGSEGTMLLSKIPFEKNSTGHLDMKDISALNHRGVLYGDVKIEDRKFHVSCTHLTANLMRTAPYAGDFKDWEEENMAQVQRVIDLAEEKGKGKTKVLLGDFNNGTAIPSKGVKADFEDNWKKFGEAGFIDPISFVENAECTTCNTNNLNEANDDNNLIDHAFYRDGKETDKIEASVILKEKVKIEADKQTLETNLSDHFGVLLKIGI